MKRLHFFAILMVFAFGACSTSSYVYDDVYYSRNSKGNQEEKLASATQAQEQNTIQSANNEYEYQSYYQNDVAEQVVSSEPVYATTETVVEPDGTTYTTTETYYDSEYAQRLRRFNSGAGSSFGYFDGYNSGCFDCSRSYFSMGFGYPYGMSWSMGYGYPYYGSYWNYYDPFFYDSWYYPSFYSMYSPWRYSYWGGYGGYWNGYRNGYMHGYWDGYYGGSWDYPNNSWRSDYFYGHRGSYSGGTTIASGSARGTRTELNQGNSTTLPSRGTRSSDAASVNKSASVSERGAGQRGGTENGQAVMNRPERSTAAPRSQMSQQGSDRAERSTAVQNQSKPTTQQKMNEYRQRYDRPVSSSQNRVQSRAPQYERPRSYTAPSARQPKSSNEYVRPQAQPGRNYGTVNKSTPTRTAPAQGTTNSVRTQTQVRSSGSTGNRSSSYSQPSRSSSPSYSQPSRSSSSYQNSSSSSGSSSSSSSRGSSSSSSSSSRSGGRR